MPRAICARPTTRWCSRTSPPRYSRTVSAKAPCQTSTPAASTPNSVEALREFATAGGTLVFLNRASSWAVERLGVKARNALAGVSNREHYCPGSLLNARIDARHPLALGLPETLTLWMEHSPAWETPETAVARYPETNLLASGWLLGEKYLAGRAAVVDARLGKGHVVLFGMLPQYRAQSYQAFKLFFNSLLFR